MFEYGLQDDDKQVILDILKAYPQIEDVILFGSRAFNTFKVTSDIDLAIKGKDIHTILAALIADFEESDLIYEVDLVDYAGISTEKLLEHIDQHGKVFYRKGWVDTTIGKLVNNKVICKPFDGNHGEKHPKGDDFVSEGVPFVMASDLKDGKVDLLHCNFITKKQADSLRKGFAKNDDVLLSHKATIGRTAFLETSLDYVMLTPQVTYYRVKDKSKLSNVFLKYYFDSHFFQNTLLSYAGGGSTRLYIGITNQLDLPVILPPISEQKSIANILSSFDDKIELLREQNKTLETLAQTIFKEWFVNFNYPGATGERVDSELGEIPTGWQVKTIDELIELIIDYRGKTPKKLGMDWSDFGIPALSAKTIKNGKIVRRDAMNIGSKELYDLWMKDELERKDILLTSEAPLGEMYYLSDDAKYILSQRLFALRASKEITSEYLYHYLFSPLGQYLLKSRASGSTVEGIRQSELRKIEVILPEKKLWKELRISLQVCLKKRI